MKKVSTRRMNIMMRKTMELKIMMINIQI